MIKTKIRNKLSRSIVTIVQTRTHRNQNFIEPNDEWNDRTIHAASQRLTDFLNGKYALYSREKESDMRNLCGFSAKWLCIIKNKIIKQLIDMYTGTNRVRGGESGDWEKEREDLK